VSSSRSSLNASVAAATICAFAMIAFQVAGKATRDALFLSSFDISALPVMLIAAALISIGVVAISTRAMSVVGPAKITPLFFVVSAVLMLAEWGLTQYRPRPASVIVYLHVVVLGAVLISGFWSVVNERFDARTAKRKIGRIAAGATLGGLAGGVLAERVAVYLSVPTMLPILSLLHLICAVTVMRLRPVDKGSHVGSLRRFLSGKGTEKPSESGFSVLRRTSYLRNLAMVVFLGNLAATLIDFLFKAKAAETLTSGADLMRFFAVFYTVVSLVTFGVQVGLARRLLERLGIANTVSLRPGVVTVGGLVALPVLGLPGLAVLRGVEAAMQSSLFRAGYELLYTPVLPEKKRATKGIVDVGVDRVGDAIGGGAVRLLLLLPVAVFSHVVIIIAVLVSLVGFFIARALQKGYVTALEKNLINRAGDLDEPAPDPSVTMMMESFAGVDMTLGMEQLSGSIPRPEPGVDTGTRRAMDFESIDVNPLTEFEPAVTTVPSSAQSVISDPQLSVLAELRSGDARRVKKALGHDAIDDPVFGPQLIPLLAWDAVSSHVAITLVNLAPGMTGQLIDRLLDPDEDFAVRRRIPRILGTCFTERSAEGLLRGLRDKRFEVRYQSGRALARLHEKHPELRIDRSTVFDTVRREVHVDRRVWESQRVLDMPEDDGDAPFVDEVLRERTNRSMEHVFTTLSLVLPKEPLQIAFRGLLTSDDGLRGTGLEYLESVLPPDIWESLQPFIEDTREPRPQARSSEDILEDLMRSNQSIDINLKELRKRWKKGQDDAT